MFCGSDPGLELWTKASSCARDLSIKALTGRLGPFELPRDQSRQATTAKLQRPFKTLLPSQTEPIVRDFPPIDRQAEAVTSQTVFFTDAEFEGRPVRVSRANYLAFLSMRGSEVQGG